MDTASTAVIMTPSFSVNSNGRDSNCQNRVHERFAEDVCWKLAEQKVDAGGGIHLRSTHALEQELQSRTESTVGLLSWLLTIPKLALFSKTLCSKRCLEGQTGRD